MCDFLVALTAFRAFGNCAGESSPRSSGSREDTQPGPARGSRDRAGGANARAQGTFFGVGVNLLATAS